MQSRVARVVFGIQYTRAILDRTLGAVESISCTRAATASNLLRENQAYAREEATKDCGMKTGATIAIASCNRGPSSKKHLSQSKSKFTIFLH